MDEQLRRSGRLGPADAGEHLIRHLQLMVRAGTLSPERVAVAAALGHRHARAVGVATLELPSVSAPDSANLEMAEAIESDAPDVDERISQVVDSYRRRVHACITWLTRDESIRFAFECVERVRDLVQAPDAILFDDCLGPCQPGHLVDRKALEAAADKALDAGLKAGRRVEGDDVDSYPETGSAMALFAVANLAKGVLLEDRDAKWELAAAVDSAMKARPSEAGELGWQTERLTKYLLLLT